MSREAIPDAMVQPVWSDNPLNGALIIACLVVLVCDIKDFFVLARPLIPGLLRWKPLISLEHNMQLARTRNRLAFLLILPTCLIIDWASLLPLPLLLAFAAIVVFVLLRRMLSLLIQPRRVSQENWNAATRAIYSYFIVLSVLMLISAGILGVFHADLELKKIILYGEIGAFYLLSLTREMQIVSSQCGPLLSFLYLCGLELPPAAAVVSAAVLLV